MDEEASLECELQEIVAIMQNDNPEEMLEFNHQPGTQENIGEFENFISLANKVFTSREDFVNMVRQIGWKQGYAPVIKRSIHTRYVIMGCDRGGKYRPKVPLEERKKRSSSRLIGCPFEIWGKKINKSEGWKVEIKNLCHNHEASTDMSGHPTCRRFSEEEVMRIKEMHMAGIQPRQILSALRQSNSQLLAISRNVYNKTAQIRKEKLAGRPIIKALMEDFGGAGFIYNINYDQDGRLIHLFFAHPKSIELTKSYPNVFVMDCTYKTNKYKMPLLDIIGVSSFNTSFYSCFIFMQKEEEEDYVWALRMFSSLLGPNSQPLAIISDRELALMNAISVVFPRTPNLLCLWHIEKNVVAKCKSDFKEEVQWAAFFVSWTKIVKSPNETSFNEAWESFAVEYKGYESTLNYLRSTWLTLKEKFVSAWTDQITHLGNHVTSRAEGAHATLKKYLQVSTGSLQEVTDKICLVIDNQFQDIKTQLSTEKIRVPALLDISFFQEILYHVSFFALYKLYEQYESAKREGPLSQCKGQFFKTMGLPCVHMIREMRTKVLSLNDIHTHWRIDSRSFNSDASLHSEDSIDGILFEIKEKYSKLPLVQKEDMKLQLSQILGMQLPLILEPQVQPHKGRPLGSKKRKEPSSSTRREPSLFEIMDKTARRCSTCKQVGHDCRKCPSNGHAASGSNIPQDSLN